MLCYHQHKYENDLPFLIFIENVVVAEQDTVVIHCRGYCKAVIGQRRIPLSIQFLFLCVACSNNHLPSSPSVAPHVLSPSVLHPFPAQLISTQNDSYRNKMKNISSTWMLLDIMNPEVKLFRCCLSFYFTADCVFYVLLLKHFKWLHCAPTDSSFPDSFFRGGNGRKLIHIRSPFKATFSSLLAAQCKKL